MRSRTHPTFFPIGIETEKQLEESPFLGSIFEGFIASEIMKNQVNRGRRRELYFFRDEQGLDVHFLAPGSGGKLHLIEAKWSKTITPDAAGPLRRLGGAIRGRSVASMIVHRAPSGGQKLETVAPGVKAVAVEEFLTKFPGKV